MEEHRPTVIIREKSDNGALKMAAIVALVFTSPFWFVLGIVIIGCFTSVFTEGGGGLAGIIIALALLVPPVKDRISGKYDAKKLKARIDQLEAECSETRLALLHLQEGQDFDRTLNMSANEAKAQSITSSK